MIANSDGKSRRLPTRDDTDNSVSAESVPRVRSRRRPTARCFQGRANVETFTAMTRT
ncbi:hypothetical protein [Haloplanus halobius]|uniref:hypothetical protein n=1 Tax=Haloplanus halobius TaxID=2934938 RepID=UPI00200F7B71|nr:hypothetical protein [Haloplanus sp. XH21]